LAISSARSDSFAGKQRAQAYYAYFIGLLTAGVFLTESGAVIGRTKATDGASE